MQRVIVIAASSGSLEPLKQIVSALSYETFFRWDGVGPINPDARPFVFYDPVIYHGARITFEPDEQFRFYMGIDNITNKHPPLDVKGTGGGSGIYDTHGRFYYAGAVAKF